MSTSGKSSDYRAEKVLSGPNLADIRIHIDGKTRHMWGRQGIQRELDLAGTVPRNALPVLLGAGLGVCARRLVEQGYAVIVTDHDPKIRELADLPQTVQLLDDHVDTVRHQLHALAEKLGKPLYPVRIPFYLRLNPDWYGRLAKELESCGHADFWQRMAYPRFQSAKPRILFMDADYFLSGEILTAMKAMDIPHAVLPVPRQGQPGPKYMETLLHAVLDFKPDFLLTVNHFGLDRQGKITDLLQRMNLPLASWFVDNPHLILYRYAGLDSPNVVLFTYDSGNIQEMKKRGFLHVHHLPLATDPKRFRPGAGKGKDSWQADISFVGNSMLSAVQNALLQTGLHADLEQHYRKLAEQFGQSDQTSVAAFLEKTRPDMARQLETSCSMEQHLAVESLITWESTRQYRLACVEKTLPFAPLIVGDAGWKEQLGNPNAWRHLKRLDYYRDLPRFYPRSTVNFNCTSLQMKGAVNQRVFDVPACGGFLITDHREQLEALFEPGTECITYDDQAAIPELIRQYLSDTPGRTAVVQAARARILARHTYEHRMQSLCATMRQTFA
jgi:spore maturation protein CgeB